MERKSALDKYKLRYEKTGVSVIREIKKAARKLNKEREKRREQRKQRASDRAIRRDSASR